MALSIFRAERRTDFWSAKTPESVGPGCYTGSESTSPQQAESKKRTQRSISTGHKGRGTQLTRRAPGPGTYNLAGTDFKRESRAGTSSFASRQQRLAPIAPGTTAFCYPSSYQNPGPGYYDAPGHRQGLTGRKSLTVHAEPTTASIPQQRKFQERDRGPAYYSPANVESTKGTNFSKTKGRTSLWESTTNPGPGHYLHSTAEEEVSGHAIFLSTVKRLREVKATNPGPGTYESQDVAYISTGPQPPFGSAVERGQTWTYDIATPYTSPERIWVPGVGTYSAEETRSKSALREKESAKKLKPGFLSSALRDCLTQLKTDQKPGPGAYESTEMVPDSGRFLSGERRFTGLFTPREGPSPGEYHRSPDSGTQQQISSRRTAKRFQPLATDNPMVTLVGTHQRPPVGQYDLQLSWKLKAKDLFQVPDAPVSFESVAERFQHNELFPGLRSSDTPGPGHYLKATLRKTEGKAATAKATRFQGPGNYGGRSETGPELGPGSYTLPTALGKPSFNLTIETGQRS